MLFKVVYNLLIKQINKNYKNENYLLLSLELLYLYVLDLFVITNWQHIYNIPIMLLILLLKIIFYFLINIPFKQQIKLYFYKKQYFKMIILFLIYILLKGLNKLI